MTDDERLEDERMEQARALRRWLDEQQGFASYAERAGAHRTSASTHTGKDVMGKKGPSVYAVGGSDTDTPWGLIALVIVGLLFVAWCALCAQT